MNLNNRVCFVRRFRRAPELEVCGLPNLVVVDGRLRIQSRGFSENPENSIEAII